MLLCRLWVTFVLLLNIDFQLIGHLISNERNIQY